MAINPLQPSVITAPPRDLCAARKVGSGSSAFETLLQSLKQADGKETGTTPQAAAELLRIEMMKNSLSLSCDPLDAPPSDSQTMQTLLNELAATLGTRKVRPGQGVAAPPSGLPAATSTAASTASPGSEAEVELISETASHFIGTPYRFGGEGPSGIDCSSFVQQVFHAHQIDLPRTAREQINVGSDIPQGDLRKGDLVFFQTYAAYPSHVGIYLGDGKMIHASSGKGEVTISDINSDYYRPRYLGAKRVI